ncbi:CheR family methyltransferase [Henriciella litoralis]|uniref:CheR family methyltransferase n=1 Tax=Henriciella litoralis TaxID=568102 RepID=UPI000A057487|nr:protein-glutamate O-methyltransferase CheR [Henriciella litoralis]
MDEMIYREIADLAQKGSGQFISPTKSYLIEARLAPILRREGFSTVDELVACLNARPGSKLAGEAVGALTSKTTSFFSERQSLERVVNHLLPKRAAKAKDGKLRIWCAGGSTGQEAYSLAILLEESTDEALKDVQVEIVSTDICKKTNAAARSGIFGHFEVQKGLSIHRLLKHFTRLETGEWQVSPALARRVGVRPHNLMKPADGLGQFDIILCRNVICDMARPQRSKALLTAARQLAAGGTLVLGKQESAAGLIAGLDPSRDLRGAWVRNVETSGLTIAA